MLMTRDETGLTELAKLILGKMRESGEWLTRKQIAELIGRTGTLLPYDVGQLEKLEGADLIEVRREKYGVIRTQYLYRAKQ